MNIKRTQMFVDPIKAVAPQKTYDFGFGDDSCGYAPCVRNGRIFEKNQRRMIFQRKAISGRL